MIQRLGIDVGGSGVKGAIVDLRDGRLLTERFRIPTPQPSIPASVTTTIAAVAAMTDWSSDRFGCTLPSVVTLGVVRTAANIDSSWIGVDGEAAIGEAVGAPVTLLNDADAAGLAEVRLGSARDRSGVVLLLTFGTGIGSALFNDGVLVPNTEFGHLEVDGAEAEHLASAKVQEDRHLPLREWGSRVNRVLKAFETIVWPDLIVFGGGISKDFADFSDILVSRAPVVPAIFRNSAGIVGAALAAEEATP